MKDKNPPEKNYHIFLIIALIGVVVMWLCWPKWIHWFFSPTLSGESVAYKTLGEFGDLFGSLNVLFAGIGCIGIAYTLFLQRETLRKANSQFEQNKALQAKEHFEGSFFQLLEMYRKIVDSMSKVRAAKPIVGYDYLEVLANSLESQFEDHSTRFYPRRYDLSVLTKEEGRKEFADGVSDLYIDNVYKDNNRQLAHYFRIGYRILRLIDEAPIPDADKMLYAKIFRGQLSSVELVLLTFNCFGPFGRSKMKRVVERYGLLKHLISDYRESLEWYFRPSAFGDGDLSLLDCADSQNHEFPNHITNHLLTPATGGLPKVLILAKSDSNMNDAEKIVHLRAVDHSILENIKFADQKASIFITINIAMGGVVWSLIKDQSGLMHEHGFIVLCIGAASIAVLFSVVFPWGYQSIAKPSFSDPNGVPNHGGFPAAVREKLTEKTLVDDLSQLVEHRSKTNNRKYWLLRIGLTLSALGWLFFCCFSWYWFLRK